MTDGKQFCLPGPSGSVQHACAYACRSLLDDPEVRSKCLWQNMRIVQPYVSEILLCCFY